jgi:hypothetical protein
LYASEVISDQVRHRASDQGDQNRVETSNRTTSGGVSRETSVSARVGVDSWGFVKKFFLFVKSDFLVFQELSSYCTTMGVFDRIKTFIVEKGCPLLLQYLGTRHLHLKFTSKKS